MKANFRWKFTLLVIIPLLLVAVTYNLKTSNTHASTKTQSIYIKAPVPKLPYMSNRSFYILANTGKAEEFVKIDISFHFMGINQQECFERNDTVFRDVVYRFLKDQTPQSNTAKEWNEIVKKQLIQHLSTYPGRCKIADIAVELVQRF
jgi:flagellar basal body-associated protein FliL